MIFIHRKNTTKLSRISAERWDQIIISSCSARESRGSSAKEAIATQPSTQGWTGGRYQPLNPADLPRIDAAARAMLHEAVEEVLGELSEREQEIVRMRFGLDGAQAKTLEEVGKEFGVTRERIRQIESKALRKLRHPSRASKLKPFWADGIQVPGIKPWRVVQCRSARCWASVYKIIAPIRPRIRELLFYS